MSHPPPARAPALDPNGVNPLDPHAHCFGDAQVEDILHFRSFIVGQSYYGIDHTVEYIPGNLPLICTVPHGGYAAPSNIPDRRGAHVVAEPDIFTQELARLFGDAFAPLVGSADARPHLIINRLIRPKLDMNRNEEQATMGHPIGRKAWRQFHAFVRRAKREIVLGHSLTNPEWRATQSSASLRSSPPASAAVSSPPLPRVWSRGLCLDLHGQSHDRRHQLGYILNQADLSGNSDAQLDASVELRDKCSVRAAVDDINHSAQANGSAATPDPSLPHRGSLRSDGSHSSLSSIIRGPLSLGAMLERLGPHPCIPSPSSPHAGEGCVYFNGSYNTFVHGSSVLGTVQREKEQLADAQALAAASAADGASSDSSSAIASTIDPDPAFSSLFSSTLEGSCFVSIQLESAFEGQRDSHENRQRFAANLARACIQWMEMHVLGIGDSFQKSEKH